MNLLEILKELIKEEYEYFLYDCLTHEKDPCDYLSSDDWLINGIKILWKYKIMDSHGFSLLEPTEMIEKYGDIILFQYPEFLHGTKPINCSIKLRTLLNLNLRF